MAEQPRVETEASSQAETSRKDPLGQPGARDYTLVCVAALLVQVVVLLALSDEGAPGYDHDNAAALSALGVPAFACTPDAFPDLMAAAIERRDLKEWSERRG